MSRQRDNRFRFFENVILLRKQAQQIHDCKDLMMEIYAVRIAKQIERFRFETLLGCLPEEKQARIKRFLKFEDSMRALAADILARTALCRRLNLKNSEISFSTNAYGKPFLDKRKDVHFNVSHSGEWGVCAVDSKPIGIDIQEIHPIDLDIAKRFFSQEEYKDLLNKDENERLFYFYDLWTLKESYIKAVGKGLSIPLDSFTIRVLDGGITLESKKRAESFYLRQYSIDADYKLSVCATHRTFPHSVIIKDFDDVCTEILEKERS